MEKLLEQLAIIGSDLVQQKAADALLLRMRRAYKQIRDYPSSARCILETIGLQKDVLAKLLELVPHNTLPAKTVSEEMLAFVDSCTPTDEELAENLYWMKVLAPKYYCHKRCAEL